MMVFEPMIIQWCGLGEIMGGALIGQTFNILLTFAVVWLLLSGKIFPQPDIKTFDHKEDKVKAKRELKAAKAELDFAAAEAQQQAEGNQLQRHAHRP